MALKNIEYSCNRPVEWIMKIAMNIIYLLQYNYEMVVVMLRMYQI